MENEPSKIEKLNLSEAEWRERLTPEQFNILREEGTEPAYSSPLNDEKREGEYICAGCALPLFSADKKYESHTGWPSFWDIIKGRVETKLDFKLLWPRTEYHCARCGGHQGHVFKDGPEPTGLRYCNNGLALNFVPKANVEGIQYEKALFAGGCFWCMESPFDKLQGVVDVTVGYTGGNLKDPTYEQVSRGSTGHYESIQITFDPNKVSYSDLLDIFWRNIDPLDSGGQFCDRGQSYQSAIFYMNPKQMDLALESKARTEAFLKEKVATQLVPATSFYPAEDYHQYYYKKNPVRYKFYRYSCGRDKRLQELWGSR